MCCSEATAFTYSINIYLSLDVVPGFPGGSVVKNLPAVQKDEGSIPGLRRSPGEGNGIPLQYSCLENPMDCIVHGVAKSRTRLSNFHFHTHNQETIKGHKNAAEKHSTGGSQLFLGLPKWC